MKYGMVVVLHPNIRTTFCHPATRWRRQKTCTLDYVTESVERWGERGCLKGSRFYPVILSRNKQLGRRLEGMIIL